MDYVYDALGRPSCSVAGQVITYSYDALNRPTHKGGAAAGTDYAYDNLGRLTSATFTTGGQGITNAFDALNRLTSTTSTMGGTTRTLSYAYDLAGQRTQVTHPDGAYFTTSYDVLGRAGNASWTIGGGTTPFMGIGYDNLGRRTSIVRASSFTDYGYDNVSRVTTLTQRFAGNTGNTTQTFSYNPASQITSETRDNDAFAFPTSQIGSVNRDYAANGLNQYTSAGPAAFSYDGKGNLTSDGTRTYSYDAENRLVTAVSGGITTNLTYDPLGRLFQVDQGTSATTTRFLYDGAQLAAEYDGSNAMTKRYYFGPGEDEPILEDTGGALNCSGTRFLHTNQQGSVIALADCVGNQTNVNSYDEYGIPASNTGRFQYTGQMWLSELGMYYYKNRIYSPTLGRFLQTDPIGYAGDGPNLYAYVLNDPINSVDALGLCQFPATGGIIPGPNIHEGTIWCPRWDWSGGINATGGVGASEGGSNDPGPKVDSDDQDADTKTPCSQRGLDFANDLKGAAESFNGVGDQALIGAGGIAVLGAAAGSTGIGLPAGLSAEAVAGALAAGGTVSKGVGAFLTVGAQVVAVSSTHNYGYLGPAIVYSIATVLPLTLGHPGSFFQDKVADVATQSIGLGSIPTRCPR